MSAANPTIVALSGGVDSAVAALLLAQQGHAVECLHMSNWDDDDGYCDAAADLQDARRVCDQLGLPLHQVSFAREYRELVFNDFLHESRAGRTPNPDVLCNREIKFGILRRYADRLGGGALATGHYARLDTMDSDPLLLKAVDLQKDQSYFLHAVAATDFSKVSFPLGDLTKSEVRKLAAAARLPVATKRDSTGICFIGERPFGEFLGRFIPPRSGSIVTEGGQVIGEHCGLHLYTLGQRKGIGIGGTEDSAESPWYVAAKRQDTNELVVVQGHENPALFSDWLAAGPMHWIGPRPALLGQGDPLRCQAKTRYRQPDQSCSLVETSIGTTEVVFDLPQRAVTPGQYVVFYLGDRCLGGARIEQTAARHPAVRVVAEAH